MRYTQREKEIKRRGSKEGELCRYIGMSIGIVWNSDIDRPRKRGGVISATYTVLSLGWVSKGSPPRACLSCYTTHSYTAYTMVSCRVRPREHHANIQVVLAASICTRSGKRKLSHLLCKNALRIQHSYLDNSDLSHDHGSMDYSLPSLNSSRQIPSILPSRLPMLDSFISHSKSSMCC